MTNRCRTPGCGRFIGAGQERCAHHPEPVPVPAEGIGPVLVALQTLLTRLMNEETDLETQVKHVPRIATAAVQAIRAHYQMSQGTSQDVLDILSTYGLVLGPDDVIDAATPDQSAFQE